MQLPRSMLEVQACASWPAPTRDLKMLGRGRALRAARAACTAAGSWADRGPGGDHARAGLPSTKRGEEERTFWSGHEAAGCWSLLVPCRQRWPSSLLPFVSPWGRGASYTRSAGTVWCYVCARGAASGVPFRYVTSHRQDWGPALVSAFRQVTDRTECA